MNKQSYRPPGFGEYLLYLLLSKSERENLLGDLNEGFEEVCIKFGPGLGKIWYYKQVSSIRQTVFKLRSHVTPSNRPSFRLGMASLFDFSNTLIEHPRGETTDEMIAWDLCKDWTAVGNDLDLALHTFEATFPPESPSTTQRKPYGFPAHMGST